MISNYFDSLPDELIVNTFHFLETQEMDKINQTCKRFQLIIKRFDLMPKQQHGIQTPKKKLVDQFKQVVIHITPELQNLHCCQTAWRKATNIFKLFSLTLLTGAAASGCIALGYKLSDYIVNVDLSN